MSSLIGKDDFSSFYELDNEVFQEKYVPIVKIGEGGYGKVFKCELADANDSYFAVKIVKLTGDIQRKRREVENMRRLEPHPNIIHYVESFSDGINMAIVMEYCEGCDLFDYIEKVRQWKSLTEDEARQVFFQLASALSYIHSHSEIHRDIKPENIFMVKSVDENAGLIVKLLDFGVSKYIGEGGESAVTVAGTVTYMAPEIVAIRRGQPGTYGPSVDCWSLGILLYVLLFSTNPQMRSDGIHVKLPPTVNVKAPNNSIGATDLWNNILSAEVKDLIQGLLSTDPATRMTMDQALGHPWITNNQTK
eukprot:gene7456-10166_t